MIDISKITREDILVLPNKEGLLEKRIEWLKKQRKEDKRQARNKYETKLRKLGYEGTRELHAFETRIFNNGYVIFMVRQLKSGEVKVYNKYLEIESKRGEGPNKHTKHFAKCGNGQSYYWCKDYCEKRKKKECLLVRCR